MEIRTQSVLPAGRSRAVVVPAAFHRNDSFRVGAKILVGAEGDFLVLAPPSREAAVARLLAQLSEGGPGT